MTAFLAAAIQLCSGPEPEENRRMAAAYLAQAAALGVRVAALPEYLQTRPEPVPNGPTCRFLSDTAKQYGMWILGGSLLEERPGGLPWNTSVLFAPDGRPAAVYRKLHLCDIAVPGMAAMRESDRMTPGDRPAEADGGAFGKFGLSTCYDVRFPELYRLMALDGVHTFFVPSDFARATGRAHRELLLRTRALENGAWVIAPQQCGQKPGGSLACGQTMIVDPWGQVVARMEDEPGLITARIDPEAALQSRAQLGLLENRRADVYELAWRSI